MTVSTGQDGAEAQAQLASAFREMGIQFSTEAKALGFSARVEVLNELLEYLLTTTQGASHETLFMTDVSPDGSSTPCRCWVKSVCQSGPLLVGRVTHRSVPHRVSQL